MTVKQLKSLVSGFCYVWLLNDDGNLLEHAEIRELSSTFDDVPVSKIEPDFSAEFADTHHRHCTILAVDEVQDVVLGLNIYIADSDITEEVTKDGLTD